MNKNTKLFIFISEFVMALLTLVVITISLSTAFFFDTDHGTVSASLSNKVEYNITTGGDSWDSVYTANENVLPGGRLLQTVSVSPTTTTSSVLRVKCSIQLFDSSNNLLSTSTAQELSAMTEEERTYHELVNDFYTFYQTPANMHINTSSFTQSGDYFYYNEVVTLTTSISFVTNSVALDIEKSCHLDNHKIVITIETEAVQAKQFSSSSLPSGWSWNDIPSSLQSSITTFNS